MKATVSKIAFIARVIVGFPFLDQPHDIADVRKRCSSLAAMRSMNPAFGKV